MSNQYKMLKAISIMTTSLAMMVCTTPIRVLAETAQSNPDSNDGTECNCSFDDDTAQNTTGNDTNQNQSGDTQTNDTVSTTSNGNEQSSESDVNNQVSPTETENGSDDEVQVASNDESTTFDNSIVFPIVNQVLTGEQTYELSVIGSNCTVDSSGTLVYDSSLDKYELQIQADNDLSTVWNEYDDFTSGISSLGNLQLYAPFEETISYNLKLDNKMKVDTSKLTIESAQAQFETDNPAWKDILMVTNVAYDEGDNTIKIAVKFKPQADNSAQDALQFMTSKPSQNIIWKTPEGVVYIPKSSYESTEGETTLETKGCISQYLHYVMLRSKSTYIDTYLPWYIDNQFFPGSTVGNDHVIMQNISVKCNSANAPLILKMNKPVPTPTPTVTPTATPTTETSKPDQFLITFLDCNGNTVKVEWVSYQGNATAPTGFGSYSGYTNVSANIDLKPTSCNISNKWVVPNTAEKQ
jgi:hypothetical protein